MTMLSNRIGDYWYISQGKTRIPGVNDGEAMEETDVSPAPRVSWSLGEIHNSLACRETSRLASGNVGNLYLHGLMSFFFKENSQHLSLPSSNDERGGVRAWLRIRHPLAPRLRKLPAAAIGVRGDWGCEKREILSSRAGKFSSVKTRRNRSPPFTRSPIHARLRICQADERWFSRDN